MHNTRLAHRAAPCPSSTFDHALATAVEGACGRIAPTWPLDRFIAVNPFWGLIDRALPAMAGQLLSLSGSRLLMPRAWYRQAYAQGRFNDRHIQAAIDESKSAATVGHMLARVARDEEAVPRRSRVADVSDAERDLVHEVSWHDFVTHSVSQFCAAYFDAGQAAHGPDRTGGLFASWRRQALVDKAPALLMGLRGYLDAAQALPPTAHAMLQRGCADLAIPISELETYFWSLLLDQNGWAAWCAYQKWSARLAGSNDEVMVDLLAIRLAWEWLLYRTGGKTMARRWERAMASWPIVDAAASAAQADDWLLQRAMELAWHESLLAPMTANLSAVRPKAPTVQAVFCIDVRSEIFRRALETTSSTVQTLGSAGFFGLPIAYQPLGSSAARPQLPGLLAPQLLVTDTEVASADASRWARRLDRVHLWKRLRTAAVSTFTFVEAMGLTYAANLLIESVGASPRAANADLLQDMTTRGKPRLAATMAQGSISLDARCELAAGVLRSMSLTHDFARLVLLAGHGSDTRNNPHAAGLDCGACGGQTGEVNARAAAALLNDRDVRRALAARGIHIPDDTHFVPGLHHTTTDDVALFDIDELPPSHAADLAALRAWLTQASVRARAERSGSLGLKCNDSTDASQLATAIRARTRDWAQVRPEWGLANNAAFIIAPREHCRHVDLAGRAFLHDYRCEDDVDFRTLEAIMAGPMVVTHWINMQYYASTVDNVRYGSGNKVLHNVVGGHVGVFEGNGGDLRIGLPLQSVHNGRSWVHTPLRLSVIIEAPRDAIAAIVNKLDPVRQLVDNGWLDLFQLDASESAIYAYRDGGWSLKKV